jgi:hypothetical protein
MSSPRVRQYALSLCALLLGCALLAQGAFAQGATGKIIGRVLDATGQPVQAAQVSIDGTNRGNITDPRGNYFINEVPAGLVRVVAQRIGYQTVIVSDQRVLAGQTLTLDFKLEQAAVQVEALVIQGERNPLVPRDQVASKSIVTGETIDQLPLDNATSIILLQPGVVSTNDGRTIRGSRPGEEAVYVDGVLVRRYGTGDVEPLELPTNSLAQVDVTTGGFGARFGEAQSGIINYVTRTGGSRFQGSAALQTDRIAPVDWTNGLTRAELSVGGPISKNLTYFLATVVEGRLRGAPNEGRIAYFPVGVDTVFRVANTTGDSVDIIFPEFQQFKRGEGSPFTQSDEWTGTAKLSYGLGSGNKIDLSYYKNRNQGLSRSSFNPQSTSASVSYEDVLTLGGYFVIAQSAEKALALDVKASYQRDLGVSGNAKPDYFLSHRSPFLGFNLSSPDFLVDWHDYPVTEDLVKAHRSSLIIPDSTQIYPGRTGLSSRQAVEGYNNTLRINPYGIRSGFALFGIDGTGISYSKESRWVLSTALDWQANRYNRVQLGGDYTLIDIRSFGAGLYSGSTTPSLREPRRGALFLTDRLDLGDVVIDGGIRFDYFDARTDYPIVPGFVYNVPDSLKAGCSRWRLTRPVRWAGRIVSSRSRTAAVRLPRPTASADGTLVCKSNWAAEIKKAFSRVSPSASGDGELDVPALVRPQRAGADHHGVVPLAEHGLRAAARTRTRSSGATLSCRAPCSSRPVTVNCSAPVS